jgi:uncharacterized protein (TIGR00725 family)
VRGSGRSDGGRRPRRTGGRRSGGGCAPRESPPNPHVEIALFTGLGDGRNYVNACASDALIAIGGRWGTLSEIALAKKLGRPVVLLQSWELPESLPKAESAAEAVSLAFEAAGKPGLSA